MCNLILQDILHDVFRKFHTIQERIRQWQAQHWELSIESLPGASPTAPDLALLWTAVPPDYQSQKTIFSYIWTDESRDKPGSAPPARRRTLWKFSPASLRERPREPPFRCSSETPHSVLRIIRKSPHATVPATPTIPLTKNTASATTGAEDAPPGGKPSAAWPRGLLPQRLSPSSAYALRPTQNPSGLSASTRPPLTRTPSWKRPPPCRIGTPPPAPKNIYQTA